MFWYRPVIVYNFEVEDWHTYYVSDEDVLVHNACEKPIQNHHFFSNKHSYYSGEFQRIFNRYGMKLSGVWNIGALPHQGPHTNTYHEYMLYYLKLYNKAANRDKTLFMLMIENLKQTVMNDPGMLYRK